ncbi:MAG: hypothetical protein WHS89_04230 [Acidimicrobiales bacterium]
MTDVADTSLNGIDAVLSRLPSAWLVASSGEARLVVGPAGAFVLMPPSTDPTTAAERARQLATTTRVALAEHVSWVPFIEAVVVLPESPLRNGVAASVPLDLLPETLIEGPAVVDPGTLGAIRLLVEEGRLARWRPGVDSSGAMIDLCEPVDDIPTSS